MYREILLTAPCCQLIPARKFLLSHAFETIVLPTDGRYCPFLYQLYHCFRSKQLHIIQYRTEQPRTPERIALPLSQVSAAFQTTEPAIAPLPDPEAAIDAPDEQVTWNATINHRGDSILLAKAKRQFLVRARLLVLRNRTKLFLRDDLTVIELSDYIDGRVPLDERTFSSHRVEAREVRAGDVLFLRTSGSGEYLVDVANSLMLADGKGDLRAQALDWKPALRKALEKFGADEVWKRLHRNDLAPESSARYLWQWTTTNVIRPQSASTFYELMAILADLGVMDQEPLSMAETRWRMMDEIVAYQHRAGMTIRRELLARLHTLIDQGLHVEDTYTLSLPNLDAGTFSLFRVATVSSEAVEVPDSWLDDPVEMEE